MIKCEMIIGKENESCGKDMCCLCCDDKEDCIHVCGYVEEGAIREEGDCGYAITEEQK